MKQQKLTFLLEGERCMLSVLRYRWADSTMQALLTVTAFYRRNSRRYSLRVARKGIWNTPMSLMRRSNFPPRCLRLMPAPFTPLHPQPARNAFVYIFTEQTDCSAYIEALKAAGFRQIDWKEQGVFAATKDGIIVTVCYSAGATLIASVRPPTSFLTSAIEFRPTCRIRRRNALLCCGGYGYLYVRLYVHLAGGLRRVCTNADRCRLRAAGIGRRKICLRASTTAAKLSLFIM